MNEPICEHCGGGPASEEHERECEEDTVLYQQQAQINTLRAEIARLQARVEEAEGEVTRLSNYETAYNNGRRERDGYKARDKEREEALKREKEGKR